jgi:hypothetical protein
MIAWLSQAELEFWLALLLIAGSLWWFWLGTRKWPLDNINPGD